jgi:hypothetical protein
MEDCSADFSIGVCNNTGLNPSILSYSRIWSGTNEAVLNKVHKKAYLGGDQ